MNQSTVISLGLLLRAYARTPDIVDEVVGRVIQSVRCGFDVDFFEKIVIVIPQDHDCGETADKICKKIHEEFAESMLTIAVIKPAGGHSCEALNVGVEYLRLSGCTHATIVSNKAIRVMSRTVMDGALGLFEVGAKVVGIAVNELCAHVVSGRVQNTFALWEVKALQEVGGFDSQDGVEEIAPSIRLVRKYGPCIGVVIPEDVPGLSIRTSQDGQNRHNDVMLTKEERQLAECLRLESSFEFIANATLEISSL